MGMVSQMTWVPAGLGRVDKIWMKKVSISVPKF